VLARASTAQPYGPPYHTLNQETIGMVDIARSPYGTALNSATLAAAVTAQGSAPHLLLLKCGTWTLTTSQVIPETLRLWVPLCTTVTVGAGAILTLQAPPLVDQEQWWSGPGQVVLDFVVTPPHTAVGAAGSLQAADGLGGLAAYSGSGACAAGQFMSELLPTGLKICGTPVSPSTTGHLLTDRVEPLIPNAINLGALSSGLLRTTTSGGVAAVTTVPLPAGALVGTDAVQTLTNKFVALRVVPEATNVTPVVIDLSNTDMTVISELLQNTLITDPLGSSGTGQLLWMLVHSTLPRLLTWSATWTGDSGIPLPTTTTGGSTFDLFAFLYNPISGKLVLAYNSQLLRPDPASGVTPGAYTCPATLSVDVHGRITALTSGTCGGSSGTAAGVKGDVQLNGGGVLAADTGTLSHDVSSHITYTQGLQAGAGSGYVELTDVHGFKGWLFPSDLTSERAWKLPNTSGTLALLSDITAGSGAAISGVPTTGQLATWTNATTIQGVTALPAANFPALTGDVTTTAASLTTTIAAGSVSLAKMANLATATLIGRTTAGTGVPEALTVLPAALEPAHTGDVTNSAGSLALTIAANAVTSAKMAAANTFRTCTMLAGVDNGPVLVDADLGPQLHQCLVPVASTIVEIVVYADAGTPNVIVHRRTGTTNTAVLSSALATAASGALACSKTTGVAGIAGTTCSATLQNTTVGAGDTLGLTSGSAGGVAKRMSVAIVMTVN
jgi:hypothetical protein